MNRFLILLLMVGWALYIVQVNSGQTGDAVRSEKTPRLALLGLTNAPQPASAGGVGVEVGRGGVYIGSRHRHYYDEDDWSWRHRHYPRGAWDYDRPRRYHHWD
jgi:hypothetical protein